MNEGTFETAKRSRSLRNIVNATVVLFFIVAFFGPTFLRDQRFRREGIVVQGIVEGKSSPRARKGSNRYYVWYSFTVDGQVVDRDREAISQELWRPLKPFGPVDVTYLPSDPQVYHVGPPDQQSVPLLFVVMAFASVVVILVGACQGVWSSLVGRGLPNPPLP